MIQEGRGREEMASKDFCPIKPTCSLFHINERDESNQPAVLHDDGCLVAGAAQVAHETREGGGGATETTRRMSYHTCASK